MRIPGPARLNFNEQTQPDGPHITAHIERYVGSSVRWFEVLRLLILGRLGLVGVSYPALLLEGPDDAGEGPRHR